MRKLLFIAALAISAITAQSQTNNIFSAGLCHSNGAPNFNPGARGCRVALDTTTQTFYLWKVGVTWVAIGNGIDHVLGGIAPAYTPTKWQSLFAANDSSELYQYVGTAWVCMNCVTGATYTAGMGIAISGSNVISNTGDLSTTNELNTAFGINGTNLRITDAGGNLDVPLLSIAPVQSVTAADFDLTAGALSLDYTNAQKATALVPGFLTAADWATFNGKGNGTVTSVGLDLPAEFVEAGTPVTTTGTLSATWAAQAANLVFRSGNAGGTPSFSALTAADIPSIDAAKITTGTLPVARGGTGAATFTDNRVLTGTGTAAITDEANLTFDGSILGVTGTAYLTGYRIDGTSGGGLWILTNTALNNDFLARGGNTTMTGDRNIGIGSQSLSSNTSGTINVAIGTNAMRLNQSGNQNVAIGAGTLERNISGTANFALGLFTLTNSTGSNNVGIGDQVLTTNTSGGKNVGIGTSSLGTNSTGVDNTAVGYLSLNNSTTSQNVAMGARALRTLSTGSSDIAIGYFAGNNTGAAFTGSNDILIGTFAGDNITSSSNSIVIGHNIDCPSATTSNLLTVGNSIFGTGIDGTGTTISSGNVGIGVITPTEKLQVAGNIKIETSGKGLQLQSGTGQRFGNATLVGGTVTVTNTTVGANSYILLTRKTAGGTIGELTYTISNGASFTINSANAADTSAVSYFIFEGN